MLVSDVQLDELIIYYSHQLSTLKDIGVDVEDPNTYLKVQQVFSILTNYKEMRKRLRTPTNIIFTK